MEPFLSSAQLEESRKLAELQFTPAEIAMILGVNTKQYVLLCRTPDTPEHDRYHGGRLTTEIKLRKSIIDLALQGSSPAQTLVKKFLEERNAKYLDR